MPTPKINFKKREGTDLTQVLYLLSVLLFLMLTLPSKSPTYTQKPTQEMQKKNKVKEMGGGTMTQDGIVGYGVIG